MNKLIVDKTPYFLRCCIMLEGNMQEIHIMPIGSESIEGNIFIGRVETISKGIDAAFVNIGQKDNAFLFIDEKKGNVNIKCGQAIIVQALRDASKGKGVYITTNISFAGTYTILFPDGSNSHVGVSKKIGDKEERKRLIDLVRPHVPPKSSVVIRTGAEGKDEEVIRDLKILIGKMHSTFKYANGIRPPALIYEEKHLLEKIIRDTLSYNIEEIIVNDRGELQKLQYLAEHYNLKLSMYEGSRHLFDDYSLEGRIKELLQKKIWLKSGAFLIIDETEALVAIDVNTGKSKKRDLIGETLFYSNLEAAKEIPRQLRLRNLSGIIVIDFIDMKSEEKRKKVLEVLEEECSKDRIKTIVVGFTELGLALITRKRTREPISRTLLTNCECIGGRRYSEKYIAFNIYMKLKKMLVNTNKRKLSIRAERNIAPHLDIGIRELEEEFGAEIAVVEDSGLFHGEYNIE